ncbi:uncharacterized protein [Coffea arabica]|uniref:Myb-like domain-containing protein n=1 Tax=Coffea arabica TaxID=13443 RepID=A0ABM4V4M5_COFAR
MRQRNSTENRAKPVVAIRRSPRFLKPNQPDSEYLQTPNHVPNKKRVPLSDLTPLSSNPSGNSLKRGQLSDKAKESNVRCRSSTNVCSEPRKLTGLNGGVDNSRVVRRSPRFSQNGNVNRIVSDESKLERSSKVSKIGKPVCMNAKSETEKRVTRSSLRRCNNGGVRGNGKGCDGVTLKCISDNGKAKGDVNLSEQCMYKIEKRVTRSATRGIKDEHRARTGNAEGNESIQNIPFGCLYKKVLSVDGEDKHGANLPREPISENATTNVLSTDLIGGEGRSVGFEAEKKQVPAKRKKIQVEEEHRMFQGWTAEQELALERAYFAAMPTPHFWKKVAKMVPGKSAQECFDKIHSELLTPAQQQPRSRTKGVNASLSLSASKLLNASESDTKKLRYSKQKSRVTRRTVRQLLHKQYAADQHYEVDLFNVLESTLDPSTQCVSTPELNRERLGLDKRCQEISSSAHGKLLSLSNDSRGSTVISPAVLKKIKNKALHEKYIDQLHLREARRKAMSLRGKKSTQDKSGGNKEDNLQKRKIVKDAKNALVFCARDAIKHFHHLQSREANKFDDSVRDFVDSSEDEFEDQS